jgi:predicted amidohydrolase YtcJ
VAEAVEAYTLGSAYAEFQEGEKGSITPGKLADMVLLSQDIFSIPANSIRETRVVKTFVGGRLVFDAGESSGPGHDERPD